MKLYRKKLDSLEALKREKIRLRYEERNLHASDLIPFGEMGKDKIKDFTKGGALGLITELFSSKSSIDLAMAVGKPLMQMIRGRREKKRQVKETEGLPKEPSFARKVLVEIATGYLIGKAVQLSVKGASMLLHRRKEDKLRAKIKKLEARR